jgi:hypothetical protein
MTVPKNRSNIPGKSIQKSRDFSIPYLLIENRKKEDK